VRGDRHADHGHHLRRRFRHAPAAAGGEAPCRLRRRARLARHGVRLRLRDRVSGRGLGPRRRCGARARRDAARGAARARPPTLLAELPAPSEPYAFALAIALVTGPELVVLDDPTETYVGAARSLLPDAAVIATHPRA